MIFFVPVWSSPFRVHVDPDPKCNEPAAATVTMQFCDAHAAKMPWFSLIQQVKMVMQITKRIQKVHWHLTHVPIFCSVAEAPTCWYYHQIHSAKWIIITDHDCYHHRSPGISPNESPHLELLSSALVSVQAAPAPEKPSEKKPDAEKVLSTAIGSEMSLAPLVERR